MVELYIFAGVMFLPTYRRAARDFGADRLRARFGQRKRAVFRHGVVYRGIGAAAADTHLLITQRPSGGQYVEGG